MLAGTVVAQLLQVLLSPALTRLFTPAEFGEFSTVLSVALLLAVVFTLRYELAIVLADDDVEALSVARLALRLALTMAAGCLGLLLIIRLAGWRLPNAFTGALPFFMVGLGLLMALSQIATSWCNRQRAYRRMSLGVIAQQGVTALASVIFGLIKVVPGGLIVGRVVGQACAALTTAGAWLPAARAARSQTRGVSLKRVALKFRQFPAFNVAYSLIASAGRDFLVLAFALSHNLAAAGAYGLARTIAYLPMTFMSAALSQVFYREAATADRAAVLDLALKLLSAMAVGMVPAFTVLGFFGPDLFALIFGERWRDAGQYAAVLAVPAAMAAACSWPERLYEVARRQKVSLFVQATFDAISVLVVAVLVFTGRPVLWAVIAYAILNTMFNIAYLACAWRVSGFALRSLLKPARLALATGAISAVICLLLQRLPAPAVLVAIAAAAASVVHLLLLAYRWRGLLGAGK